MILGRINRSDLPFGGTSGPLGGFGGSGGGNALGGNPQQGEDLEEGEILEEIPEEEVEEGEIPQDNPEIPQQIPFKEPNLEARNQWSSMEIDHYPRNLPRNGPFTQDSTDSMT